MQPFPAIYATIFIFKNATLKFFEQRKIPFALPSWKLENSQTPKLTFGAWGLLAGTSPFASTLARAQLLPGGRAVH